MCASGFFDVSASDGAPRATGFGSGLRFTDSSSICATSTISTFSLALPSACRAVRPSFSMTLQNGQPVAIFDGAVPSASSTRSTLIRLPIFSSIHIRAPPAPQHIDLSPCRGISRSWAPVALTSSRGAS